MLKKSFLLILLVLIQLIVALFNGYPVVYSDTSTYIACGFGFETPFDRPITYSIFLWLSSGAGLSLWLTVFFQSLLLSWILSLFFRKFVDKNNETLLGIFALLFVCLFSTLSWVSSQLMPDIFTSILLITLILIVAGENSKKQYAILFFILLLCSAMHFSHVMLIFIMAFLLLSAKWFLKKRNFIKTPWTVLVLLLPTAGISILTMGAALAKSKHIFFMGAMVEHGITKQYLDEHCAEKNYSLCTYKDSLPEKAWQFVWDEKKSPVYKCGGWKEVRKEYGEIISATLTDPKYIWLHVKASLKATLHQLVLFKAGDGNGAFTKGTKLHERIGIYFHHELQWYENSIQNTRGFSVLETANIIYIVTVIISLVVIVILIFKTTIFRGDFLLPFLLLLAGILVNAWISATFANAIDRLGAKLIWLIPFIAFAGVYKLLRKKTAY